MRMFWMGHELVTDPEDAPCGCLLFGDMHDALHGGEPGGRMICRFCGESYKLWEHESGHCKKGRHEA